MMICVVVTPRSEELTRTLSHVLSRCREALCLTEREILLPDIAPDILLLQADTPPECDGDIIYVLGSPVAALPGFTAGRRAVAVIQSQNAQALAFAAEHHIKTLTCGLSSRDTLTLSSIGEESALLCIQREVTAIGGEVIEPSEISVRLHGPIERGELLTAAAVLLLCGDIDRLSGAM